MPAVILVGDEPKDMTLESGEAYCLEAHDDVSDATNKENEGRERVCRPIHSLSAQTLARWFSRPPL